MGIEDWRNRWAAAGSMASSAAIPRWEMAKLMDRCSVAALEVTRESKKSIKKLVRAGKIKRLNWHKATNPDDPRGDRQPNRA